MHLSYQEHVKIYSGLCKQQSGRVIAKSLGRDHSVIYREIARNSDYIGYLPPEAAYRNQQQKKKIKKKKVDQNNRLRKYVVEKLTLKWSPKVIAGRS